MTNQEFKYWLDGFVALSEDTHLDSRQFSTIQNHAELVLTINGKLDFPISEFMKVLNVYFAKHDTMDKQKFVELYSVYL